MQNILLQTNEMYRNLACCHTDGRICYCYNCLEGGYYGLDPDTYACLKKLCYYTMNFGPAYSTEIYNYLDFSKLLETNFLDCAVNVISLGCGFGSDRIALNKYINDKNLNIQFNYVGIDIEEHWRVISQMTELQFYIQNIINNPVSLVDCNIVFINKLFSTLKNRNLDEMFLNVFVNFMLNTLPDNSFIIFNDVNHRDLGRDQFDNRISPLMKEVSKFFYNIPGAYTGNYQAIPNTENVFIIPEGLSVNPKPDVTKSVFFQYKK
ncbi:MAG: hypothetical protein WC799_06795 [Desulfobacteraceae bacterium]|jgi:hypothetical protein